MVRPGTGDNGLGELRQGAGLNRSQPAPGVLRQAEGIEQRRIALDKQAVADTLVEQGLTEQRVQAVAFARTQGLLPPGVSAGEAGTARPGQHVHEGN